MLFEYFNFYVNSQFYIKENFSEFTEKMLNSYQKDDLLWNIFNAKPGELSKLDRESSLNMVDRQDSGFI